MQRKYAAHPASRQDAIRRLTVTPDNTQYLTECRKTIQLRTLGDLIVLNQQADALLNCEKKLILIPGAIHLFEEPGILQQAARTDWFAQHL